MRVSRVRVRVRVRVRIRVRLGIRVTVISPISALHFPTSPLSLPFISPLSPQDLLLRGEVELLDAEGVVDDGARKEHLVRGDMGEI